MQSLLSKKIIFQADKENKIYIHINALIKLEKDILDILSKYHQANPLKAGMPKEELKSRLPAYIGLKLSNLVLAQMIKDKSIIQEGDIIRLKDHKVSLKVDQAKIRKKILDIYKENGLQPPYFKEVVKNLNIDSKLAKDVLLHLVDEKFIIKVKEDLYFDAESVKSLKNRLLDFLKANNEITTPQFKDMTGASRKYVIPLLEYLDSNNITIRIGDIRRLRKIGTGAK
ncbi:MAG TPA: selenocysteine-specific translation factor, partial [Desulfobacteraceae bacterium]|nr:selenocysteine-specific translation factor [Desulfobacteraceae bacterium]